MINRKKETETRGRAFPVPLLCFNEELLRDWFAGQALAGLCAAIDDYSPSRVVDPDGFATDAYAMADAMLKAREGTP